MPAAAKILIIDDDEDFRTSTRALLEGEGYAVIEADSGPAGLAAARDQHPDLIILDVMLEHVGEGYSVNQALKYAREFSAVRDVPVIMASSVQADPASLFGWIGDTSPITPDAYLAKPFDIPRFIECVREQLAKRGPRDSG